MISPDTHVGVKRSGPNENPEWGSIRRSVFDSRAANEILTVWVHGFTTGVFLYGQFNVIPPAVDSVSECLYRTLSPTLQNKKNYSRGGFPFSTCLGASNKKIYMTKKDHIWPVLVRYLDNTMSEEDSQMLEEWLEESNENRRILHSADRIWKAAEDHSQECLIKELNLERDWEKVFAKITDRNPEEKRRRIQNFRKLRKRHQMFSNILKVAALLLVAFLSAMITLKYAPLQESEIVQAPVFNEIITKPGERATVELGDGSKVFLNADSKLIMPETFSQDKREVELIGQAFFDIKSDRNRPFHVKTQSAVIEVIGTSFDVHSYKGDPEMKVVVREGTVELRRSDDFENRLIVNGGYKGRVSQTNGLLAVELIDDPDFYFGWMEGRLIFKETPIREVMTHIERWYDVAVTFNVSDETIKNKRFTADLKTRSVREVLEVIQMSMNLGFEIDGDEIIITDKQV